MNLSRIQPLVSNILNRCSCSAMLQTRSLYEQTRSGSVEFENKKIEMRRSRGTEMERFKQNIEKLKKEIKWSAKDLKNAILHGCSSDNKRLGFQDNELIKFWDFNQANNDKISSYRLDYKNNKFNDMENWYVTCDSDFDVGYSTCSWTVSPSGHALFSGYLDKTLPKDGKVIRAGYAYLGSYKSRKPFYRPDTHHEFADFTHIVLRVRGDGRRYFIIFDTSDVLDITWFDRYQYMVYTHGGPYWQYIKIPLSRFYFHYQGFVQDTQFVLQPQTIRNVGILIHDLFSGPFRLEIDYIGFVNDSQWVHSIEYEGYYIESSPFKSLGSV